MELVPVAADEVRHGAPDLGLLGHWPNPAGSRTRIDLALPSGTTESSLAIFDASGRQVRMLGTRFDAVEIMAASDIVCQPTLYEGLPVTVLDAMSLGVAVVA